MTQLKNSTESHKGTHLTYKEMVKIEAHKENNLSNREIGQLLNRNKQLIMRFTQGQ